MDSEKIYQQVRARYDHQQCSKILKEKYQAKMIFAYNGGMFRAGSELQALLLTCPDDTAVIADLYENPIMVNVGELMAISQTRWQEQMNAWYNEWQHTKKQR